MMETILIIVLFNLVISLVIIKRGKAPEAIEDNEKSFGLPVQPRKLKAWGKSNGKSKPKVNDDESAWRREKNIE